MNTCFKKRGTASRLFSWVMALALVLSLVAAPALTAFADSDTYSAELIFSAEGMNISGKITLDTNQLLLAAAARMAAGNEVLADAAAYLSTQALAVNGSVVGGSYGVDLASLAENLDKSIFAPNSGSSFALDEETYSQIKALLSGELTSNLMASAVTSVDSDAVEEAAAVLTEVYAGAAEDIMSKLPLESGNASVVINGKPVQVSELRCSADGEAAVGILETLIVPLQGNAEAQAALATLIDEIAAASGEDLGATGAELVQAIVSELPQQLPEVKQELEAEQFQVTASVCVSNASEMPVKFSLALQDAEENIAINLLMSEELDFFRFEAEEDGFVDSALEFAIQENSDKALAFKFAVFEGDIEEASLSFNLNKAGQAFTLSVFTDGETSSMSGYYNITDTLFSLTIDKIDGQDFGGAITLNLRSDDTISMPSFTELTGLSEAEFTVVMQRIMTNMESLSQMFG